MKILLLSDANSSHTSKWANTLNRMGHKIVVFTLSFNGAEEYDRNIVIQNANLPINLSKKDQIELTKIIYISALPSLKRLIKVFKPNIVHAHYASSYGLLGALSFFKPLILSVWGSDIFNFPNSFIGKLVIKTNLHRADYILSTSRYMVNEISKYTNKNIYVIPFGVDTTVFRPLHEENEVKLDNEFVIGTVKLLTKDYGIEYLIRGFVILKQKHPEVNLKLLIVGSGNDETRLKQLTKELSIEGVSEFPGYVSNSEVPKYYKQMDVAVFPSLSGHEEKVKTFGETFGVSVVEASACGVPVVISDIPAFHETAIQNKTGFFVPTKDPQSIAEALEKLMLNENLRKEMGKAGRKLVQQKFDIQNNANELVEIYKKL